MIDTGDAVLHRPTGETWLVAYVAAGGEHLVCCGWPESSAKVADCELVAAATAGGRRLLLERMAAMEGPDSRKAYAARRLAAGGD